MGLIKKFFLTGDTHGRVAERLEALKSKYPDLEPAETALIILGDAGFNFYLNKSDYKNKKQVNDMGYIVYCLRGNHEERPENLGMDQLWDTYIKGGVYYEPEFPNIRYLFDGEEYQFGEYTALVIGGAYSVDKWYRLMLAGYTSDQAETADPKKCGWFKDEQLTYAEMEEISKGCAGQSYDFVLTHTCPLSWEPTDLFLSSINQASVDKSMEKWLEKFKDTINFNVWCFGHYHADRIERPHIEQYFNDIEELNIIIERWKNYDETGELDWWLQKSPKFFEKG